MTINWFNPAEKISKYFTVREALWLPSWSAIHQPSEAEKAEILKTAQVMDKVREFIGKPITVHCWLRPGKLVCPAFDPKTVKPDTPAKVAALAALDYNAYVGGATSSSHKTGKAVDWDCGEDCDETRKKLLPKLAELGLRMEDLPGSSWVHNDTSPPNPNRFFKP